MSKPAERFQIGDYYLDQPHPERGGNWYACRYDARARTTRRRSLGTADFEQAKVALAALVAAIAKYGDDAVQFQNLDHCARDLDMNKGKTWVTFGTEQPISLDGLQKLGLVIWLDREKVAEIIAEDKKRQSLAQ